MGHVFVRRRDLWAALLLPLLVQGFLETFLKVGSLEFFFRTSWKSAVAGGGLGAGLAPGLGLALWLDTRNESIRNEADLEASFEMPYSFCCRRATGRKTTAASSGDRGRKAAEPAREKIGV